MHDVKRDSLFEDKGSKKKHVSKKSHHSHGDEHDHDEKLASKYPGYELRHVHEDDEEHDHGEQEDYQGHDHDSNHEEEEYHAHEDEDEHHHNHPRDTFSDRAFEHLHDHGHQLLHSHHHVHHREEASVVHKWFNNPARDWFALIVGGLLTALSGLGVVGGTLGRGFLVMASVIGLFPLVKNSVIRGIIEKRFNADLAVSLVLIIAMIYGQMFYVAVTLFLILLGSFLRLDFSWNK